MKHIRSVPPQHNDHCLITFMGENWRILSVTPGPIMLLRSLDNGKSAIMDGRNVDWLSYVNQAASWLNETPL